MPDCHMCILQVIAEHSRQGYMATSVFPLAKDYLDGQQLPGGIKPEEWDGFHDLIVIDEVARCGYLGVIWALTCGNSIGAPPLINFGNEDQKRQFLPSILNGTTRFCLAVTDHSWIGCCRYYDDGRTKRRQVCRQRSEKMDHEWTWERWCLCSHHSIESPRRAMQKAREFRCNSQW
ncbi:hypothetical protein VFPPC_11057 [Pochonia chlamydosporia 170]|uniref:Acyl-CoA dehydrogenase/oxidase N-terminal domain-containing protein n=1 Tax=Pochonia chlamydosporia 170 TaxID=1380566 RepID=A0A179F095_METCM|nr:hypothetical protein VFPPC_11057 [Pochonia chlamydosporia 170]OAQ58875.2 hypothetical protein VFPPC_11057 [Pochonia chlamydosporia 170]